MTQFTTNHGKFNEYLHSRKIKRSPSCPCGGDQSAIHLICTCPIFFNIRPLHTYPLHQNFCSENSYSKFCKFIKHIHNQLISRCGHEQTPHHLMYECNLLTDERDILERDCFFNDIPFTISDIIMNLNLRQKLFQFFETLFLVMAEEKKKPESAQSQVMATWLGIE